MNCLSVNGVSVEIGQNKLLETITLEIRAGSIVALVGHNGAGKSTLIKTIMGITEKSVGEIVINDLISQDEAFIEFKQMVSYLPEEPLLLTELTVMQHFQLYGMSYEIAEKTLQERIDRYVKGFELTDKLDVYPESLSKGMRQKVQTICAFLPDTPLILIDEPFMGLDIYAIDYLEKLIKEKAAQGVGVLLTTHQLERVKNMADAFLLLQQGEILKQGPIADFDTIERRSGE